MTVVLGNNLASAPRPFYPADPALWFRWNRVQSVPISLVFIAGYGVLAPLIFLGERRLAVARGASPRRARLTAARFALGVLTATMLSVCLVEFGKGYVGRLRPNFAERCLGRAGAPPDSAPAAVLSDAGCAPGHAAWDGRRSFPSGHSALAAGLGAYAQLWLVRARAGVLGYLAGFVLLAAGFAVGASRVVDNAHHVSDVVAGALVGAWISAVHFWMVERETEAAERRHASAPELASSAEKRHEE